MFFPECGYHAVTWTHALTLATNIDVGVSSMSLISTLISFGEKKAWFKLIKMLALYGCEQFFYTEYLISGSLLTFYPECGYHTNFECMFPFWRATIVQAKTWCPRFPLSKSLGKRKHRLNSQNVSALWMWVIFVYWIANWRQMADIVSWMWLSCRNLNACFDLGNQHWRGYEPYAPDFYAGFLSGQESIV